MEEETWAKQTISVLIYFLSSVIRYPILTDKSTY